MDELRFPGITPSSIKRSEFHEFENDSIKTEEDFHELVMLMFHYPERDYYLYQEKDGPRNELLLAKERFGEIVFEETKFFYYRHPNDYGYVHIEVRDGKYKWDWEREVVEKGPMFMRTSLRLSEQTKTQLTTWQKIEMEEVYRKKRIAAENMHDVFISYASADGTEANMLYEAAIAAGGKVFLAAKSLNPGEDFAEKIRAALAGSKELWLLVSPNSLRSDWVLSEWGAAWVLSKPIIPILHRCSVADLPDRLQRLQCIDFYRHPELVGKRLKK